MIKKTYTLAEFIVVALFISGILAMGGTVFMGIAQAGSYGGIDWVTIVGGFVSGVLLMAVGVIINLMLEQLDISAEIKEALQKAAEKEKARQ